MFTFPSLLRLLKRSRINGRSKSTNQIRDLDVSPVAPIIDPSVVSSNSSRKDETAAWKAVIYVDVENGCHQLYMDLLSYLKLNDMSGWVHVYLYLGNVKYTSSSLWDYRGVTVRRNSKPLKQLVDVQLTLDLYQEASSTEWARHVIISGGDSRYDALVHVMRERNVDCQYVKKFANQSTRSHLQRLDKILYA